MTGGPTDTWTRGQSPHCLVPEGPCGPVWLMIWLRQAGGAMVEQGHAGLEALLQCIVDSLADGLAEQWCVCLTLEHMSTALCQLETGQLKLWGG